ncbi:hypothetical protein ACTXT7_010200 [Hymenolepis weldensis]
MPGSNSSGSTASNATKSSGRRKRGNPSPESRQIEYELNKDGEIVPVSSESTSGDDLKTFQDHLIDQNNDNKVAMEASAVSSSRNKRKQTFERKNIKRVRDDSAFSEEAQNAQKAEMERRMRLKIEEQAMAAQWKAQNVSFSQPTFIPNADGIPLQHKPEDNIKSESVDVKSLDVKPPPACATTTASAKLFKQKQTLDAIQPDDTIIVIGESDDEIDFNVNGPDLKLGWMLWSILHSLDLNLLVNFDQMLQFDQTRINPDFIKGKCIPAIVLCRVPSDQKLTLCLLTYQIRSVITECASMIPEPVPLT